MSDFNNWDVALLRSMGLPVTKQNRQYLQAWHAHEGGTAAFNPLNTTQGMPGATDYNSVHVRNYTSAQQGLDATIKTLKNGYYPGILAALKSGNPTWNPTLGANLDTWGTGSSFMKGYRGTTLAPATGTSGIHMNTPNAPGVAASLGNNVGDFRSLLMNFLLNQHGKGAISPQSLLGLVLTRQNMGAAQDAYGPSKAPSVAPVASQKGFQLPSVVTKGKGLAEAFYDPLGSYDSGHFGGAIGGHSDHVHLSITNPQSMLTAITAAQKMGMRVGENPYTGKVNPVHVTDSFHYRTFPGKYNGKNLGEGIDVSGSPEQMAAFYKWAVSSLR